LTAVESDYFRNIFVQTPFSAYLPSSGDTIRRWIMENYELKKQEIKRQITKYSKGLVHVSFDLWTSPNQLSIFGMIIHYMNDSYKVQTRLIGLKRLTRRHSGENIASTLFKNLTNFVFP